MVLRRAVVKGDRRNQGAIARTTRGRPKPVSGACATRTRQVASLGRRPHSGPAAYGAAETRSELPSSVSLGTSAQDMPRTRPKPKTLPAMFRTLTERAVRRPMWSDERSLMGSGLIMKTVVTRGPLQPEGPDPATLHDQTAWWQGRGSEDDDASPSRSSNCARISVRIALYWHESSDI
jgi:hypothetical protein